MERVLVMGGNGAGKTTFSLQLADNTGLPVTHLDRLSWTGHWEERPREEFDALLLETLRTPRWIIDGNYGRTMELRLQYCDTVFLLDYPLEVCLAGARARIGIKREEIPWVEEELDETFRQWIIDFPQTKLPRIYELLEQYGEGKEIHVFRSRDDADNYLESITA